jgi:hypothetical protein
VPFCAEAGRPCKTASRPIDALQTSGIRRRVRDAESEQIRSIWLLEKSGRLDVEA